MISSRITRGAVRTHLLIRKKIENLHAPKVLRSVTPARALVLSVIALRVAFLPVPLLPTAHAAALPDMPADSEPPSTIPVDGASQREGIINGITFSAPVSSNGTDLVPFHYSVSNTSTVVVGDSFDTVEQKARLKAEEDARKEREAARLAALKQKRRVAAQASVVVAAPSADKAEVVEYVRQKTIAMFGESHWTAMSNIIMRESGFNLHSRNKSSGACGLFQALPCKKMGGMELTTQVNWGMNYVKARYGNPSNAWAFWLKHHWY